MSERSGKHRSPPGRRRRDAHGGARQTQPSGFEARRTAVNALAGVLRQGQPLDDAFEPAGARPALADRDRALARLIVATALRRLPQIDAIFGELLKTPIDERGGMVREILVAGAAQILFLGSARHAVVNIAVAQAAADRKGAKLKGLVNAVLRRVAEDGPAMLERQDAVAMVLPQWLQARWDSAYGAPATRDIAALLLNEPPLDLSCKSAGEAARWAERLGGTMLPSGSVRLTRAGKVTELDGFDEGAWWVQDAAAALPAPLTGAAPGKVIVDLCAAPGGKTAQIAATGARVIAVDRSAQRMRRLEANLARLELAAECIVADARTWRPSGPVDAVLLDAPCSATGIMRRQPDILRTRKEGDIAALAAHQRDLLGAAMAMLKPGGRLVYATCSLEPEEGEAQIAHLLSNDASVSRVPIAPEEVPGFAGAIQDDGTMRVLPTSLVDTERAPEHSSAEVEGSDGFFVARLNKT